VKVFLSYAVGPGDAPIAARLRAVAAVYDISILLPDRTLMLHNGLPTDTQSKIREADAFIVLATNTAPADAMELVNLELQYATQARKPIIALVEEGVRLSSIPVAQVVYFNRYDPTVHETLLVGALNHIRNEQVKQNWTALGWIAGIALGLVALSEMFSDEKE
jgi:16S rRNA G1207 methylase RsmC